MDIFEHERTEAAGFDTDSVSVATGTDMSEQPFQGPPVGRRTVLGGIAALTATSLLPVTVAGSTDGLPDYDGPHTTHAESHHPGHPRFVEVGEEIRNAPWATGQWRPFETFAPRLPDPQADPENYDAEQFEWSIAEKPENSDVELVSPYPSADDVETNDSLGEDTLTRFDAGAANTAEVRYYDGEEYVHAFDEPGRYVLELDAPDGTHEWTIYAFPGGTGPRPQLSLDGTVEDDVFVIEATATVPPDGDTRREDIEVVFLADDRHDLTTDDIDVEGETAGVPISSVTEPTQVHAAAHDGNRRSMIDTVELLPSGEIEFPNRPPEWARDGVMYQIFPRSWSGNRNDTTFDDLTDGVEYLDDLGIDWVWLTPIVPAESVTRQLDGELLPEEYQHLAGTLSGGGPHGYDTLDYFGISSDLVPDGKEPFEAFSEFVDECHEHDIRVCFDLVISHCGRSHPLFQDTIAQQGTDPVPGVWEYPAVTEWDHDSSYFDWFARVDGEEYGADVEVAPAVPGFFGLRHMPNLNHNNLALREYLLAVADFWSGEVGIDGFRCDVAWGVPFSMWKEIREVVRDNNSEYLMLDETIPRDPRMAENAFGMHYDTEGFTSSVHALVNDETGPQALIDDIEERTNEGTPPHSVVLNLTENHDEHRLLNQAVVNLNDPNHEDVTDEEWETGAHLQRVCWAAGVLLPGAPGIYYGQERQISRFGEGRHQGPDDHRGRDNGGIDTFADVRPGGRQRAFMNWEEYPEDHLQFYRDVVEMYHELDALKPRAEMGSAWFFSQDSVLVFTRDATDLDDVEGPDTLLAIVNFETEPAEVGILPRHGDINLLDGAPLEELDPPGAREDTVLEVEDIVVLEANQPYNVGALVADFEPFAGTDSGPGTYEYPTGEEYEEEIFDVSGFSINERRDHVQFKFEIGGSLDNPREYEHGLSHQHVQIYIHDPASAAGATDARDGVNAAFVEPYQQRIVADGEHGVRIEDSNGEQVGMGVLNTNTISNEFFVEVPKSSLDIAIDDAEIAPLMLGYHEGSEGNVMPVRAEAETHAFGGAEHDTAPKVIDTGLRAIFPNEEALAYDSETLAEIPYAPVESELEEVVTFDLETGVPYGPGTYEVPTGDDYHSAAWDIDEVSIEQSLDDVRIEFSMAGPFQNPWNFDPGFSHPFPQIYLHVPGANPDGTTVGREGTNIGFREPYHYRVVAHGEGIAQVEDSEGNTVTTDVSISGEDDHRVVVEFPVAAVEWDLDNGVGIAPTITPYDGFGEGSIRPISEEADEHTIGGGHVEDIDPAVMDMAVPEELERTEVLSAYDDGEPPLLPFIGLGEQDDIVELPDDEDPDDDGPDDEPDDGPDDTEPEDSPDDGELADQETDDPDDSPADADDDGPGFGVGGALTGLGGAAYLLKRRLAETDSTEQE